MGGRRELSAVPLVGDGKLLAPDLAHGTAGLLVVPVGRVPGLDPRELVPREAGAGDPRRQLVVLHVAEVMVLHARGDASRGLLAPVLHEELCDRAASAVRVDEAGDGDGRVVVVREAPRGLVRVEPVQMHRARASLREREARGCATPQRAFDVRHVRADPSNLAASHRFVHRATIAQARSEPVNERETAGG